MPHALFVCMQDEDEIAIYAVDAGTGQLSLQGEAPAVGGPSVLALSPDRRTLYLGHRTRPAISSFRIDHGTGGLTPLGTVPATHAPTFLAPDRTGRYLLSCYYQGGGIKAEAWRRTILDLTARSALRRSIGWPRRPAPMQSRPTPPTSSPLCR